MLLLALDKDSIFTFANVPMTKLSVNINKIATLRNARGGDSPNLIEASINCQKFGADGITIHPRPDQRHITRKDVFDIKRTIKTEFNIEGYPSQEFINLILENKPEQVTLVPDGPNVITSCAGWDTIKNADFLKRIISEIDIKEDKNIIIYPQVSKQKIIFGYPDKIDDKFDKLIFFYKKILPAKGWNTYRSVNLKFENQIVCNKNA